MHSENDSSESQECFDDTIYNTEEIAWKLIADEDFKKKGRIFNLTDGYQSSDKSEIIAFTFEMLANIYLEMIFMYFQLEHEIYNEDNGLENEFKPDLTKITEKQLTEPFSEKMNQLDILLHVRTIDRDRYNYLSSTNYCRIALKDSKTDRAFFERNNIEKRFHFFLNPRYKPQTELRNVFMLLNIENQLYFKINFDTIEIKRN